MISVINSDDIHTFCWSTDWKERRDKGWKALRSDEIDGDQMSRVYCDNKTVVYIRVKQQLLLIKHFFKDADDDLVKQDKN